MVVGFSPSLLGTISRYRRHSFVAGHCANMHVTISYNRYSCYVRGHTGGTSVHIGATKDTFGCSCFIALACSGRRVPLFGYGILRDRCRTIMNVSKSVRFNSRRRGCVSISRCRYRSGSTLHRVFFRRMRNAIPFSHRVGRCIPIGSG